MRELIELTAANPAAVDKLATYAVGSLVIVCLTLGHIVGAIARCFHHQRVVAGSATVETKGPRADAQA